MLKHFFRSLLLVGIIWGLRCHAADADDIYLEANFGMGFDSNRDLVSGAVVGTCFVDGIGFGLVFDQVYSIKSSMKSGDGTLAGLEGRWFIEPVEVSLSTGAFWGVSETRAFLMAGGTYLFALTPSMAAKAELRARYTFGQNYVLFGNVGIRILF